jgi:hypothetical protein
MLFLVFVRGGRRVHGRHVVDGERTLHQSEAVVAGSLREAASA